MSADAGVHVREFRAEDALQVAALWQRVFRKNLAPPSPAVQAYFVDVLLKNPWYDPQLGPLLLERRGEVVGFVGRMARPMAFRGRQLRAAVVTQLMVDPNHKLGFAAVGLVRTVQKGPHDVLYSDGANSQSHRLWVACGGQASRLLSFEWSRRLRPLQAALCQLHSHPRLDLPIRIARPFARAWDGLAVRALPRFYHKPVASLTRRIATPGQILPLLQRVSSTMAIHPEYSESTYDWVIHKAAESESFGELRSVMVFDRQDLSVGWFIYFARAGGFAHVLQVGALPGSGIAVLNELYRDAWEQRAVSVCGQLDPMLLTDLSNTGCKFTCHDLGVLIHSNETEILNALYAGDIFISRLEGEWWMRLGIDRHMDW